MCESVTEGVVLCPSKLFVKKALVSPLGTADSHSLQETLLRAAVN